MAANDRQAGGNHYASDFQPWDFINDNNFGFLEGCAIKYVSRWRTKNGKADLEKADHFVEKLAENAELFDQKRRGEVQSSVVYAYCNENKLIWPECQILLKFCSWETIEDLEDVRTLIRKLKNLELADVK